MSAGAAGGASAGVRPLVAAGVVLYPRGTLNWWASAWAASWAVAASSLEAAVFTCCVWFLRLRF